MYLGLRHINCVKKSKVKVMASWMILYLSYP